MAISHPTTPAVPPDAAPSAPPERPDRQLVAWLATRARASARRRVDSRPAGPQRSETRDASGRFDPYSPEAIRVFRVPPRRI